MSEPDEQVLSEEQQAAVEARDHAIAVLAGPGSGKTRTLSHRARHLLRADGDAKALLLTFTNKAAAEMKARAIGVAAVASDRIQAGTFHSFGARLLRSHGDLLGLAKDFEILDEAESKEFAASAAKTAGTGNRLAQWQYSRLRRTDPPAQVAEFGAAYQAAKLSAEVVDFDDLVVFAADLLGGNEEIARAYGGRFANLLVDEFQDTNAVQFDIVQALCPYVSSVSVFADDDQAIFRFVGAESANIRRFVDQLGATEYPLVCNYRSREKIVKAANALIAADPNASGRAMRADRSGGEVEFRVFGSTDEEAEALAEEIESLIEDVPPTSIAVLVRSGYRAHELVAALRSRHLPVTDWRGDAYEPEERRAFGTAMSVLRGRLNDRRAARLCEFLGVPKTDEEDTHAFLGGLAGNPTADDLLMLRELAFAGAGAAELAAQAQKAVSHTNAALADRMGPLVAAVEDFERHDPEFAVDDLLAELALGSGGRAPTEGGGVRVASLHKTKGLQWPIVYMLGLEDGHMPDFRSEEEDLPEERRACFVGVCRAEDRLVLTFARRFRTHRKRRSVFLEELGLSSE